MYSVDDYKAFLAEVRKFTGIESFEADESGLVSVRLDDKYNVNLQYIEATVKRMCQRLCLMRSLTALPSLCA